MRLLPCLSRFALVLLFLAASAFNTAPAAAAETLDIDANGTTDALTDGLLIMRYMFGIRGASLVQDAVGAARGRTDAEIETSLATLTQQTLDIDGNGSIDALTDGLMIMRYMMGVRGADLTVGITGAGATRTTPAQIEAYLATLIPTVAASQAPTGCSVVASPSSSPASPLAPGTAISLTANCTGGQQPITHTWDNGAFIGSVRLAFPQATTTYSVVASNAAGSTPAFATTAFVTDQGGGGTPEIAGGCGTNDVSWPASGQVRPVTSGFSNGTETFRIAIPFTFSPSLDINHVGFFSIAERPGTPVVSRDVAISRSPCDFSSASVLYSAVGTGDTVASINFTVNNPGGYLAAGAGVNFQSGDVIYVSVRNANNGAPSCDAGSCDILFDFATPNRY